MYLTVYLLLLAPAPLAAVGPCLTRRLAPAAAARALAATTLLASAATVWGLAVLAAGGLGRTDEVLAYTRPGAAALAATDPVPRTLGALAAALLACGLARLARTVWCRHRGVRALAALRALPAAGDLVVLADERPDAYALPGHPRRIVISSGILRALPAAEHAVLLAHERAHLTHRHHLYTALAEAACALNPLLRTLRDHLAFVVERWADEDAAAQVASRRLAARSLAHATVVCATPASTGPAATGHDGATTALTYLRYMVSARVRALQGARLRSHWGAAAPAALAAATTLALTDTATAFGRFLAVLHP